MNEKNETIKIQITSAEDAEELLAIYAPYVEKTAITFEYDLPSVEEFKGRITHVLERFPYLKAVEIGKPVAINLSFGNTYGSHDGTSLLERFLDNVSEIGRTVICVGSGNEGAAGGHISGSFASGQQRKRIELNVGNYQSSFSVQLWKEYVDRLLVALISPSGIREEIDTL